MIYRIGRLQPDTSRQWGTMSAHEMICHLSDPFRDILGIRNTTPVTPEEMRPQLVEMVLGEDHFGQNLPTFSPYLQGPGGGGTLPDNFETDKTTLIDLIQKFHSTDPGYEFDAHAGLGILNREQLGLYSWKHLDHHLKQFGM